MFRSRIFICCPGTRRTARRCSEPGDLITHVTLPPPAPGNRSLYLKLRDRASYEFALASAAVVITTANGKITRARSRAGRRRHEAVAIDRGGNRTNKPTRD